MAALNAKYIHSSLAIHSLYASLGELKEKVILKEFTINHSEDFILSELFGQKPDVIAFSCYIWNIRMVLSIISAYKKIAPDTIIILGGPEVSYEYDYLSNYMVDYIVVGEGENSFRELVAWLTEGGSTACPVKGVAYWQNNRYIYNGDRTPVDLNKLNFVYSDGFETFHDRILYYETTRGCPFCCQYCLSSVEKGVRFLQFDRIKSDLDSFLTAKVRQVKFVDRTFNCNKTHAMQIWEYLISHDNGITNFHFEISADLIDQDMFQLLRQARTGLFQFEIGVQSTNPGVLDTIQRKSDLGRLFKNVQTIKAMNNISLHLDLIAGLPLEDLSSFRTSFNSVYECAPHQLQLGFLKLLRGSGLRAKAEKYDIQYKDTAPYEVLFTGIISYAEILELKQIEELLEQYYNSGKFIHSLRYITSLFSSPYSFFKTFADYWHSKAYHAVSHTKIKLYTILFEFCNTLTGTGYDFSQEQIAVGLVRDLLKFDLFRCDNLKTLPHWLEKDHGIGEVKRRFYGDNSCIEKYLPHQRQTNIKQIVRGTAIQRFEYDILDYIYNDAVNKQDTYILFDYTTITTQPSLYPIHHASFSDVTEDLL